MLKQFKEFLVGTNAVALAIGVIIGGASTKVVSSLVDNILMPLISMVLPSGDWQSAGIQLGTKLDKDGKTIPNMLLYGKFFGAIVDFLIISLVVFYITKLFIKPAAAAPTKTCPFCGETVPETATRCKACTSQFSPA